MGDPSTVFPACSCSEYMYCKHGLLSHFSGRSLHRAIIQVAAKATENHYSPSLSIPKPLSGNVKHWKITKGFFFAKKEGTISSGFNGCSFNYDSFHSAEKRAG